MQMMDLGLASQNQKVVFRYNLAVFSINLAVFSINLAVFSINLAVFSVNLAVFSINLAVLSINLAVFSINLAVFSINLAVFSNLLLPFYNGRVLLGNHIKLNSFSNKRTVQKIELLANFELVEGITNPDLHLCRQRPFRAGKQGLIISGSGEASYEGIRVSERKRKINILQFLEFP